MSKNTPEGRPGTGGADRVTIMFVATPQLLEAIDQFAEQRKLSRSGAIREAVAKVIGYDLSSEPKADRKRKYANAEERKQAMLERAKERRQLAAKLLKAYEAEDTEAIIKALVESQKSK